MKAFYITLCLSKSNFKDHYGDAVIKQCLGKIAEINEFSAFDEMLRVTRQTGRQQFKFSANVSFRVLRSLNE